MDSIVQLFPNHFSSVDSGQVKADLRKVLEELGELLDPDFVWPGHDFSKYQTKTDAMAAWITQWYEPLSFHLEQNKLYIVLPNQFFGFVFQKNAAFFFETALQKVYPEIIPQYRQYYVSSKKVSPPKPFISEQTKFSEDLDAFLVNSKNDYTITTLKKFCSGELPTKQILLRGQTGSGKTHLLKAMARKTDQKNTLYYDTTDMIESFRHVSQKMFFRQKVSESGFLALDNIHLLVDDLETQTLCSKILDYFHEKNLPVVMSAAMDQQGNDPLRRLIPELRSRLSQGIILILYEPDLDIRLRYTKQLFVKKNIPHTDEYALFLARKSSGLRQLQGISEQVHFF